MTIPRVTHSTSPHGTVTCIPSQNDKLLRQLPQAIGHRGYNAKYPENTMSSFTAAVKAGADALETDVHLSRDDVVVLSHAFLGLASHKASCRLNPPVVLMLAQDATLKRCFGVGGKIIDYDWSDLSKLRSLKEPHDGMPRLLDLLLYLAAPGMEKIWLLLDIKVDNNIDDIMRLIAQTIHQAPLNSEAWVDRIVLGCWAAEYHPLCARYLPGFSISHIGFDISYARQFLKFPKLSFNMRQTVLMSSAGHRFLCDARAAGHAIFVWTVNEPSMMRWSIRRQVDGVITDDPAKFLRIRDEYDNDEYTQEDRLTLKQRLDVMLINTLATFFTLLFLLWYGFSLGPTRGMRNQLCAVTTELPLLTNSTTQPGQLDTRNPTTGMPCNENGPRDVQTKLLLDIP